MNNEARPLVRNDERRHERKADYQPGYLPVLCREELKMKLREFRDAHFSRDSHLERCLVSACIEFGLRPDNQPQLMELLAQAVAQDFLLGSMDSRQAPASRNSA